MRFTLVLTGGHAAHLQPLFTDLNTETRPDHAGAASGISKKPTIATSAPE